MNNRLSVVSVLVQNFLFCTVVAVILWKLVPSVGQYGFFNNFVHAQAIGNSICLLAVGVTRLTTRLGFSQQRTKMVPILLVTPVGKYLGMSLAGWWLELPSGPFEFLQDTDQLAISAVTAVIASIAFSWHLNNREKVLRLELEAVEERHRADVARHTMLQAQLEPHMLFNTLANLRALIRSEPKRAVDMLDRLDSFLRETLSSSQANNAQQPNTLKHEFQILDDYLALMQIRLGKRLAYSLDLPADCPLLRVPPLLLQPLVENAIRHGIEPQIDGGRVDVSAQREKNHLILIVADTGIGISDSDLENKTSSAGFGLENLRERLQHAYNGSANLSFESAKSEALIDGTRITIRIPLATAIEAHPSMQS